MLQTRYMKAKVLTAFLLSTWVLLCTGSEVIEKHGCFGTMFDIVCGAREMIVFEEARYGRNNSAIARECNTMFTVNCDIDVHFLLNKECAGKSECYLAVNTALFTDPCGYEEFLQVKYQCIPVNTISQDCSTQLLYDHGYIASPNYPSKYPLETTCYWSISVQQRQTIKITILDFELSVKSKGVCKDVVEISSGSLTYFKDCGGQGRASFEVDANQATVMFRTGSNSLAQRGFMLYFEALGPGCPDLVDLEYGSVVYYVRGDILFANATCERGYLFLGTDVEQLQLQCMGSAWNKAVVECIAYPPNTTPESLGPPTIVNKPTTDVEKGSFIGIALGIVSALLLLVLLLIIAVYFQKRRRHRKAEKEHWRVVMNNLQENEINSYDEEQRWKNAQYEDTMSSQCNIKKERRSKNKKINNKEEELQGRNLLPDPYESDRETFLMDYSDLHRDLQSTPLKATPNEPIYNRSMQDPIYNKNGAEPQYNKLPQRRGSRGSKHMLFRKKSFEGLLDEPQKQTLPPPRRNKSFCSECGTGPKQGRPQSQKDLRHKRTKSGHFDPNKTLACIHPPDVTLSGNPRALTQSAPDLFELCKEEELNNAPAMYNTNPNQIYNYPTSKPVFTVGANSPQKYGPGVGVPVSVYSTQNQTYTDNTPLYSFGAHQQPSYNSDNTAYRNVVPKPRPRKSPQYVVPPTPPERNVHDQRC